MIRFTIRDVLWLMVVVGLGAAWWIENREHQKAQLRFGAREQDRIQKALIHQLERQTGKRVTVEIDPDTSNPFIHYREPDERATTGRP